MNFLPLPAAPDPGRHSLNPAWAVFQSCAILALLAGCDVQGEVDTPAFTVRPGATNGMLTTAVAWTRCAAEGAVCEVPALMQVRFGLDGRYNTRIAEKFISCTNAVFGDPYPGVEKVCEYASRPGIPQAARVGSTRRLETDSIFAPTSFWYQPIPKTVVLHANSREYVAEFLRQKAAHYGTVSVATSSYASPVYVVPVDARTSTVRVWDCQKRGHAVPELARQWSSVPVPGHARPSRGTDGEMTIYQPSTNTIWEFWQMRTDDGRWQACWGGRMTDISTSDGIWPRPYGTTATGLPFLGGQVTAEELQRGEIRHVIGISLVDLEEASVFSWPANRSDGSNPHNVPNRIPEGTRFRLDPTVDVDTLRMSAAGKVIAKAAQTYGFVVWDKAGSIGIRAQNAQSYTVQGQPDPYPTLFNGKEEWAVLEGFPWDRLQFLPKDYGKR